MFFIRPISSSSRAPFFVAALLWIIAIGFPAMGGAQEQEQAPEQTQQQGAGDQASGEQSSGEQAPEQSASPSSPEVSSPPQDGSAGGESASPFPNLENPDPSEVPTVALGEIEPGFSEAKSLLAERFSSFLERQPLGFDRSLGEQVIDDITQLSAGLQRLLADPSILDISRLLELGLIGLILALMGVLFLFTDWHSTRTGIRLQSRIHFDLSLGVTAMARHAILIGARAAPVLGVIIFSFFPVRALYGPAPWALLLTDALLWLLAYRLIHTAIISALRLHPRSQRIQKHQAILERFALIALRLTLGFMVLLAAVDRLGYHEQALAFVSFGFRLTLAILPAYLLLHRQAVLSLLPAEPSSRLARALFAIVARNYYLVLALTVVLLAFNAAGYIDAATFFLTRGYALLVVGTLWFVLLERIHHLVERSFAQRDDDAPPSPLLKDLQYWLVFMGVLVMVLTGLNFLRIYEPVIALISPPLVSVGALQLSLFSLINVALIIAGFTLSIRLFKSLLNAKVYPAFDVDIGVAYASNTLLNYLLFVVGFVMCLIALGVPLSAVMVVMASLGVGIGFGLQNIAENLISGFILLFGRAVKKGDYVTVNDLYGRVEAVGARSVIVRTPDNYSMLVPSKEMVSGRIINWTFQDDLVRVHIPIGVSYDADPSQVRELLMKTAKNHPDILADPPPDVWLTEFGDSSVNFELLVFFDCRTTNENTLRGKFNFLLWEALREADIEIPFPQRDLHVRSVDKDEAMPQAWRPDRPADSPPD